MRGYWISGEQFEAFMAGRDEVCASAATPQMQTACLWLSAWLVRILEQPLAVDPDPDLDTTPMPPFDASLLPLEATATEPFGPPPPDIDVVLP